MILGAILGGGRSSRFGSDKAEALWRGVRLIDHVHARLATVAAEIVVCGWQGAGFRAVADRPAAGQYRSGLYWRMGQYGDRLRRRCQGRETHG